MSFRDQLLRVGRVAVFLQERARLLVKNSVSRPSGDKGGWARLAEANSQIVSIRDQVSEVRVIRSTLSSGYALRNPLSCGPRMSCEK